MKNGLLFVLLSSFLMLTSCRNNDYNLGFELGSTEEDIIEYLQENNLKCRYEEKKGYDRFVLRVYDFKYKNIEFGTIRLAFSNDKLCYTQYRIHNCTPLDGKDNISQTMSYLKKQYGEPKENANYKDNANGKYYWGEIGAKFMIIEPCSEDYIKVHIADSSLDSEVPELYRELLLN